MTDKEKFIQWLTENGKRFHNITDESGYSFVAEMRPRDTEGYVYVGNNSCYPLTDGNQLDDFIEFGTDGSWRSISQKYELIAEKLFNDVLNQGVELTEREVCVSIINREFEKYDECNMTGAEFTVDELKENLIKALTNELF